jgi:hypothetical protein
LYKGEGLPRMNSRNMERYCAGMNAILWKPELSDKMFNRTIGAVDKASEGDLDRDNFIHGKIGGTDFG